MTVFSPNSDYKQKAREDILSWFVALSIAFFDFIISKQNNRMSYIHYINSLVTSGIYFRFRIKWKTYNTCGIYPSLSLTLAHTLGHRCLLMYGLWWVLVDEKKKHWHWQQLRLIIFTLKMCLPFVDVGPPRAHNRTNLPSPPPTTTSSLIRFYGHRFWEYAFIVSFVRIEIWANANSQMRPNFIYKMNIIRLICTLHERAGACWV